MTITSNQLFGILVAHPYPGSVDLRMSGGTCCFTVKHVAVGYNINGWLALGRVIPAEWTIPGDFLSDVVRVHAEIDRVLNIAKQPHTETQTMTTDPTHVSINRYRELEAELKTVTKDRDTYKARQEYTQEILNQIWDATGWPEKFDEPDAIEYIKRLKSKADRAGLLSVICRRLCGDENATTETVHKALDRVDDEGKALEYIGAKVGSVPYHLGEVQSSVAQLVKSLSDKTVSLEQTKQSLEWFTQEVEKLRFERDTERVGNKRLTETIEDLKCDIDVKHSQTNTDLAEIESALDQYNLPTHYGNHPEGNRLGTVERVRIGLLVLWSKWSESHREAQESEARADRLTTERYLVQELLDKLNAPRLAGGHELDLSARIRSLFTTKV